MVEKKQNDFGFTFASEEEFLAQEKELRTQVATQARVANVYQNKIQEIRDLIDPLLEQLSSDPIKVYIKWSNRVDKIKALQDKLTQIYSS